MRGMLQRTALALLLLAAGVVPAAAQTTFPIIGPGGVVDFNTASTTCVNTTASCALYNATIPTGLVATSPASNMAAANPPSTPSQAVRTPPPLHLQLRGTLTTPSGGQIGTINAGANYGGTTATIALLNAHTPVPPGALSGVPIQIDVWYVPLATAIGANTGTLSGRVAYSAAAATETVINSFVVGTTRSDQPFDLNVSWLWGSGSNTNSLTIFNKTLVIGN